MTKSHNKITKTLTEIHIENWIYTNLKLIQNIK